jgi:SAM-dependent methyltransferase
MATMYGLFHPPAPFDTIPADWSRPGIGLSDVPPLVPALQSKVAFTNTYFHQFPRLDLRSPPPELVGALEFVICSDVLEHVPPPIESALHGMFSCIRPDGFAVVTVPVAGATTDEYYPGIVDFEVREDDGSHVVEWTDADGAHHIDPEPDMHGGSGQTLAFRSCAAADIAERLRAVGFDPVWEPPPIPELGIFPIENPGVFLARRP